MAGRWKKGESGNPMGPPPKKQQMTEILRAVGGTRRMVAGKTLPQKRILGAQLWEAVTTGCVTFADDEDGSQRKIYLTNAEWIAVAKLVIERMDGPPRQDIDLTSNGQTVSSNVHFYLPDNSRDDAKD